MAQDSNVKMTFSGLTFLLLVVVTVAYILVGAGVFVWIERSAEQDWLRDTEHISDLAAQFSEIHKECNVSTKNLTDWFKNVVRKYRQSALSLHNRTTWTFPLGVSYATSVITTIGYGDVTPKTTLGMVLTVFYALFGVPLCGVTLIGIGERLQSLLHRLDRLIWSLSKCCTEDNVDSTISTLRRGVRAVVTFFIGLAVFVVVPSTIFAWYEDWAYGESLYFAFITLTTIGFGDYVPGSPKNIKEQSAIFLHYYRIFLSLWMFFGLSWLVLIFNLISDYLRSFVDGGNDADVTHEKYADAPVYGSPEDIRVAAIKFPPVGRPNVLKPTVAERNSSETRL